MILSFHPCFEGDQNIICAGRRPDDNDLAAIKKAKAVILPQGCRPDLYNMAASNCSHLFPDYRARFEYPGKIGQASLFQETGVSHPKTIFFLKIDDYISKLIATGQNQYFSFPCVFKFDWGGEGETVYLIQNQKELDLLLEKAVALENTGQSGFLLQEYIKCDNKSLRVVVINRKILFYWRVQPDPDQFCTSLAKGAIIKSETEPGFCQTITDFIKPFCLETGINLAGFDLIFDKQQLKRNIIKPLLLEINWFFGRRGLGGSDNYYKLLVNEINRWLNHLETEQERV